jgi:hypothetical protein
MRNIAFAVVAASVVAAWTMVGTSTPANARCRGCAVGAGIAAGVIGGLIIGGAIADSHRHHDDYYDGPPPDDVPDDAVAYCMHRFKSYDPDSGTYLGYDGYRHPCP